MKEQFVLPEYWYIEITDENKDLLIRWRGSFYNYSDDISNYKYLNQSGSSGHWALSFGLLSTQQFKDFVFNEEPKQIIKEDYEHLINLLHQLDIK